jgi:hypothetical protein
MRGALMSTFNQAVVIHGELTDLRHLSPLFDPQLGELGGPPKRGVSQVALICDAKGYPHAVHLKRALNQRGVSVELWMTPLERGLSSALRGLEKTLQVIKSPYMLNLGGGGGLLGVVAQRSFEAKGWPICVVDQGMLYSLRQLKNPIKLQPTLSASLALQSFGVKATEGWRGDWFEEHLTQLSTELLYDSMTLIEPLSVLHRLAEATGPDLCSPPVKASDLMTTQFQPLLERFERAGCCELHKGRLKFSSEAHRVFCAGGWVSLYAFEQLRGFMELSAQTNDVAVRFMDLRQGLEVELSFPAEARVLVDVACIVNERLYLFFCPRGDSDAYHEQLSLYKALKRAIPCKAISLSHTPSPLWYRADDLSVEVCPADELHQLARWFERMIRDEMSM